MVSFSVNGGEANLTWRLPVYAPRSRRDVESRLTERLARAGMKAAAFRPSTMHLRELYALHALKQQTPAEEINTFVRQQSGATEEVVLLDGICDMSQVSTYEGSRIRIDWTVARIYRGERPTLGQLLETCPWLKPRETRSAVFRETAK